MQSILRIATRKSPLALCQANYVKHALNLIYPHLHIEIMGMLTEGDRLLATPLTEIGGKRLFVKELEKALLDRQADIAVHSIKDIPTNLADSLILGTVCEREDPRDAFISRHFSSLQELPTGSIVGTSSSRRACLLKACRPDIRVESLRGNVGTRLGKLDSGKYDAIILATAGLKRLGEVHRITDYLDPEQWIPAAGQGAIGIECHEDNHTILEYLSALEHKPTRSCITAERAMTDALGGGCQLPIGAYATCSSGQLYLRGLVGDIKTNALITATLTGPIEEAHTLGKKLADILLERGAGRILPHSPSPPRSGGRGLGRGGV